MLYLSGMFALNLQCDLNTCGDWHIECFDWSAPLWCETEGSLWGDYGVEVDRNISRLGYKANKANHLRALLDLFYLNKLSGLRGFHKDFICTDEYNEEFFSKVILLTKSPNWPEVCNLMCREYTFAWNKYLEERGIPIINEFRR